MATEELVIERTLMLGSEVNEMLAHFYMTNQKTIIAVSGYGMFHMYMNNINDPRTFSGSPWMLTVPGFLDYIGRVCAYTPRGYPWRLDSNNHGAYASIMLQPEVNAAMLADVTGIDVEVVREHAKNYLVFRKALEERGKVE